MKITVWIVSVILALAFLLIGGMKVAAAPADLEAMSPGVPVVLLKIAGWAEVLGALGLVLPAATRILPVLTPVAALGLVVTMVGAAVTDIIVLGGAGLPMIIALGVPAAFVVWGRLGPARVLPRGSARVSAEA
ncbi:DoxX family protein [Myceligenerans xiligouense]|uniref:DoxX-like protein n=1 Tax=Myceligenerans xiligouense TaxID=253184 RepID=A0A3N4YNW8_9MICO|nr:DoxX family protein [Myceligenerans xiligouense]RPF21146.1 DoxX-like protein [Myceligenerans xiligouense]